MARLKSVGPRLKSAAPRLVRPAGEAARLAERSRVRPNWYGTARWQRLRLAVLARDLWTCRQTGVLLVEGRDAPNAAVVDHVEPHRWDPDLFWDSENLQSVAKAWHDSEKQRRERAGIW